LKSAGKECEKDEDDAHSCSSPVEILLGDNSIAELVHGSFE
jgi:hypothetical protein